MKTTLVFCADRPITSGMCSPVGHSMLGIAVGLFYLRKLQGLSRSAGIGLLAGFVFLANAPDLDYVPGLLSGELNRYHHLVTHSICWGGLFSLGCWLIWRGLTVTAGRRELGFVLMAVLSHLAADLVTQDGAAPYGILLFWPMHVEYLQAPFWIFGMTAKNDLRMLLQWSNLWVALRELVTTAPLVMGAVWFTWRAHRSP